jgi:hypothetical protein
MSELRQKILNGSSYIIKTEFSDIIFKMTSEVCVALNTNDLSLIHKSLDQSYDLRTVDNDDKTKFHKQFYSRLNSGWYDFIFLYYNLILKIKDFYNISEELVFQKTPSFRVHLPGNLAVGEFHSDSKYNHPWGEINISVPLTDAKPPRSILIDVNNNEKKPIFEDMSCEHGQLAIFNGNTLLHGNKLNDSELTRVSFDFRLLTKSDYIKDSQDKKSFGQNIKFEMGGYYSNYSI